MNVKEYFSSDGISQLLDRLNFFSILLVAFTLPFAIKPNSILIITSAVFAIAVVCKQGKITAIPWPYYLPLIVYSLIIVSWYNAASLKDWFSELETKVPLLAFPFIFVFSQKNLTKNRINTILYSFALATLICCVTDHFIVLHRMYVAGDSIKKSFEWYYSYVELTRPLWINPTYLSLYVIFTIFILLHLFQQEKGLVLRIISSLTIGYLTLFLFLLSSRIGILSFFSILVFQIFISLKGRLSLYACFTAFFLLSTILLYINKIPLAKERFLPLVSDLKIIITNDSVDNAYDNRVVIYKCSFEILSKNISFLGLGPGNDQKKLDACYRSKGVEKLITFNPHSEYLSFLMRYGVIGLISFLLFILAPFVMTLRRSVLFNTLSLLLIFFSIAESIFSRQKGVAFFAFFFCLYYVNACFNGKINAKR